MNQKKNIIKIFLLCPIPNYQKTIKEYILIKNTLKNKLIIFFNWNQSNRWKEIENNLNKSTIIYEESSWYDEEIWEKPFSTIRNDNLLSNQKHNKSFDL